MPLLENLFQIARDLFGSKGLTPDEEALMRAALANEQARQDEIGRIKEAYNGHFPDALIVPKNDPNAIDHNIKVNRIKPIVNTSVFYLFGDMPGWEVPEKWDGEKKPGKNSPTEDTLQECLDGFNWPALALKWAMSGSKGGTAYLRVCLPDDDHPLPYLQILDPGATTILWHPRDMDRTLGYVWEYNSIEQVQGGARTRVEQQTITREPIIFPNGTGGMGWVIRDFYYTREYGKASDKVEMNPPVVWPYAWCPIIHNQNLPVDDSVYGEPDADDMAIALNKATNRLLSNRNKIIWHHSHPVVYATGIASNAVQFNTDGVLFLPSEGTIGQLVPAISGSEAEGLEEAIYDALTEMVQTPPVALGRPAPVREASGVALTIMYTPIKNKTEAKRRNYGPAIITAFQHLLELLTGNPDIRVRLTWPEIVPVDGLSEAQTVEIHSGLGVSQQTVMSMLGHNYEEELANRQEEAQAETEKIGALQSQIDTFRAASDVPQTPEDQAAMQQEQQMRGGMQDA